MIEIFKELSKAKTSSKIIENIKKLNNKLLKKPQELEQQQKVILFNALDFLLQENDQEIVEVCLIFMLNLKQENYKENYNLLASILHRATTLETSDLNLKISCKIIEKWIVDGDCLERVWNSTPFKSELLIIIHQ